MFRKLIASALLLTVAAVAAAQNKVHLEARVTKKYEDYFAKKTDAFIDGVVEAETPAGIKIKTRGKDGKSVLIPASDVLYVEYDVGKAKATQFRLPLGRIDAAMRNTKLSSKQKIDALEKARGELKELLPEVKGYPGPRKYVEFKIAEVAALLAQDDALKRDKPGEALRLREDAIKQLTEFKTLYPDFWTIVPALKTLAKLQDDAGQS